MTAEIAIRGEQPGDASTITAIVERAYAAVAYSDHREHLMIERLRGTDAFVPTLSLVASIDGEPVGHLLLTRAHIRNADQVVETLALAPLSVVPGHQLRGVGTRLVEVAHRQAVTLGFQSIVMVGIADYYRRFGYEPLSRYPIALPFEAPADNCMVLRLERNALSGVAGLVDYPEGWLEH